MANEILCRAKFIATSGDEAYHITLDLVPSGAFAYGNGHALIYDAHDGGGPRCFDARYDQRFATGGSFLKHARQFVKDQLRDDFTVEPEDDFFGVLD